MFQILQIKNFIPFDCKMSIFDIDYSKLYDEGRRIILFDLDNTIISYDISQADLKISSLFNNIKEIGFEILILSNNREKRVKDFAEQLNLKYVHMAKKPLKGGYKKALKQVTFHDYQELISVGDQIMTDVFGSNRMHIDCILVPPIKQKTEKWYTKLNRRMETLVLKKIKKHDLSIYYKIMELKGIKYEKM